MDSGFPGGSVTKNPLANAGEVRAVGSISGLGGSPGGGNGNLLAWEIPWTEDPGGLQSMGSQESDMTEQQSKHTHTHTRTRIHAHTYTDV